MAFLLVGKNTRFWGQPANTAAELAVAAAHVAKDQQGVQAIALHSPVALHDLFLRAMQAWRLPVDGLTAYFGPRAGAYFTFLDDYTRSLVLPAAAVATLWRLRISTRLARAVARIIVAVWALRLVRRLKARRIPLAKQSISLGCRLPLAWPTVASTTMISFCILGVWMLNIVSLNFQGYIDATSKRFHIPALQRLSQPGAAFDAGHPIKGWVPVIAHSLGTRAVNSAYSSVAHVLSSWDGSGLPGVIRKRLLFEALDAFLPIWWLGLVRRDHIALAEEVESLYACDQIRRMCFESVLPYLHRVWSRGWQSKCLPLFTRLGEVEKLGDWDDFDDWLEMILQFAYIVFLGPDALFVFPASLISNVIEGKSDVFKLCCCLRRPMPECEEVILREVDTWYSMFSGIAYAGVVANVIGAARIICTDVEVMPFRSPLPWAPRPWARRQVYDSIRAP